MNTTPADRWFYADSNRKPVGPFTRGEMQSKFSEGIILPHTLVIRENGQSWLTYSDIDSPVSHASQPESSADLCDTTSKEQPTAPVEVRRWLPILALAIYPPLGVILLGTKKYFAKKPTAFLMAAGCVWFFISVSKWEENIFLGIWLKISQLFAAGVVAVSMKWFSEWKRVASGEMNFRKAIRNWIGWSIYFVAVSFAVFLPVALPEVRPPNTSSISSEIEQASNTEALPANKKEDLPSISDEECLQLATKFADRLESILADIETIPDSYENDPQRITLFRTTTWRARTEADKLWTEWETKLEQVFDDAGGDYSSIGGVIGDPLARASVLTKTATSQLTIGLATSMKQTTLEQFQIAFSSAKSALDELRDGIENHEKKKIQSTAPKSQSNGRVAERRVSNSEAKAKPYRIITSGVEDGSGLENSRSGHITIVSPSSQCLEDYVLTSKQAAEDFCTSNGLNEVQCVLYPSPDIDVTWTLAIARLDRTADGDRWEVLASKQHYNSRELNIMEAWCKAYKETPSKLTDDIVSLMVTKYGVNESDYNAVPSPILQKFK